MVVTASSETFEKIVEYGMKKAQLRLDRLLLQAFMAGVYVGLATHVSMCLGGDSYRDAGGVATNKSYSALYKAILFPVAFIAIILTGAELFTGNTMTMLICALRRKIRILDLFINWTTSFVGNWLGTLFSAYFFSYLSGILVHNTDVITLIFDSSTAKVTQGFGEMVLRGIGCNIFVCLAVWFVVAVDDGAGKVLVLWFPIVAFSVGGFEHIVADLSLVQIALMLGVNISVGDAIAKCFIPVLIGNVLGGVFLVCALYWFNFYPTSTLVEVTESGSFKMQLSKADRANNRWLPKESLVGEFKVPSEATQTQRQSRLESIRSGVNFYSEWPRPGVNRSPHSAVSQD